MKINKVRLIEFILLVIFKALLEIAYIYFVYPLYAYRGFTFNLNVIKLIESYLFITFLFFILPSGDNKISKIAIKILFLIMIVPVLSFYALANRERLFVYFFIIGFCLTIMIIKNSPTIKIKKIKSLNLIMFSCLGIISILVYVILIKLNGIPDLKAIYFSTIYEIRRELSLGPKIMGYLFKWQGNVINCFLIGLAWYKRKYFYLILPLGLQFLLYLICAHKKFLFSLFLILFLIYATKKQRLMRLTLISLIMVVLLSLAFFLTNISRKPASMFIRRTLYVPALVSYNYYDFFSKNPKMYLSESKMGFGLVENPYKDYNMNITNIMGLTYLNNPNTHMNTGYMGNSYMNLGLVGMLTFSLIFGLILKIADSISKKTNISIAIAAMAVPLVSLTNGALFSVMLTGGFLFSLILVWLYTEKIDK